MIRDARMTKCLVALGLLSATVMAGSSVAGEIPKQQAMFDLSKAVLMAPGELANPEKKAVAMLVEEVERRSGIRWRVGTSAEPGESTIRIGREPNLGAISDLPIVVPGRDGYRIRVDGSRQSIVIVGNDARGVLFGVGRLLRELRMSRGRVAIPTAFRIATAPKTSLRGHQLGYRPKTNSYDGWDLDRWEQYIRDLVVFGTNAIELIPPRSDDDAASPHFPRPPMEMMVGMSKLADDYGLDVWIWYPAMDADYAAPQTVEFALREWDEVFKRLPRIDAVFVPGGDPGHTRPVHLMALLEKQTESLHRRHPKATMWVSPQSFNGEWYEEFLSLLRKRPSWLSGVVFGPQVRVGLQELRKSVPDNYPIRNYPDITHTIKCQYPVPDWDLAFALTQDREIINPRPLDQAAIFRACRSATTGFLTYSEGCNDDVNKIVWSALGWEPNAQVVDILREYGRYFIGDRYAEGMAQGLLGLERNWRGALATNTGVDLTLHQFQDMERAADPNVLGNWRFQQVLYRAYYDAYLRERLIHETALQAKAVETLRGASRLGSIQAMEEARAILAQATTRPTGIDRRARVFELAEALFQSIRMQLSVAKYKAIALGRGTNLDTIDVPLNDRLFYESEFAAIRRLQNEDARLKRIADLIGRTDPGPGGFYDDLGDPNRQPHLVRRMGFVDDPDGRKSLLIGFARHPEWPMAWHHNAQSLVEAPLEMHYDGLDEQARYTLRVVYAGDSLKTRIQLDADGKRVHPLLVKPDPMMPLEFDLPAETTGDGTLDLRWHREPGLGGNGRGCHVAEVWLIRRND